MAASERIEGKQASTQKRCHTDAMGPNIKTADLILRQAYKIFMKLIWHRFRELLSFTLHFLIWFLLPRSFVSDFLWVGRWGRRIRENALMKTFSGDFLLSLWLWAFILLWEYCSNGIFVYLWFIFHFYFFFL